METRLALFCSLNGKCVSPNRKETHRNVGKPEWQSDFAYAQQRLDGLALVHRIVCGLDVIQREVRGEHTPRVNLSIEHQVEQVIDRGVIMTHRSRTATQTDIAVEQSRNISFDAMR